MPDTGMFETTATKTTAAREAGLPLISLSVNIKVRNVETHGWDIGIDGREVLVEETSMTAVARELVKAVKHVAHRNHITNFRNTSFDLVRFNPDATGQSNDRPIDAQTVLDSDDGLNGATQILRMLVNEWMLRLKVGK
jgi:hypothetical protein